MSAAPGVAFDHVAFDLDGTLIDSREDLAAAVNHVLRAFALPEQPPETLFGYVGEGARVLVERALGAGRREHFDDAVEVFMAYYGEHLLDATVPYPGMVELLDTLSARAIAITVLTNKPIGLSRTILEGLDLRRRFVDVIGGDSLPTRKPDPAGLHRLCNLTGASRSRTLLVGDSDIDVETARAGGTGFCGVSWGLSPNRLRAARPGRVVDDAAGLLAVVERGP